MLCLVAEHGSLIKALVLFPGDGSRIAGLLLVTLGLLVDDLVWEDLVHLLDSLWRWLADWRDVSLLAGGLLHRGSLVA